MISERMRGMRLIDNFKLDDSDYDIKSKTRRIAGLSVNGDKDKYSLVIIDEVVKRVVAVYIIQNKYSGETFERIKQIFDEWSINVAWLEVFGFQSYVLEALQFHGLPVRQFKITNRSKPPLLESLAVAVNDEKLSLINHVKMLDQLLSLEVTAQPSATGYIKYQYHSEHNLVIALALAWYGSTNYAWRVNFA